jgi:hypothetical protein
MMGFAHIGLRGGAVGCPAGPELKMPGGGARSANAGNLLQQS